MTIVEAMKGKTNKSGTIVDAMKKEIALEGKEAKGIHTIKDAFKEMRKPSSEPETNQNPLPDIDPYTPT